MVKKCRVCGALTWGAWYLRSDTYPSGKLLEWRRDAEDLSGFCSEAHRDEYEGAHAAAAPEGRTMDSYETTETGQTYLRTENVRRQDFEMYAEYLEALRAEAASDGVEW